MFCREILGFCKIGKGDEKISFSFKTHSQGRGGRFQKGGAHSWKKKIVGLHDR